MAEATIELTFKMVQTVKVKGGSEIETHQSAIAAGHDMEVDYPDGSGSIGPVEVQVMEVIGIPVEWKPAPPEQVEARSDRPERQELLSQRFVQVEYDKSYAGGNYSSVGQFAYVPDTLLKGCGQLDEETEIAQYLNIAPYNIINISVDERFDSEGNPLEED